VLKKQSLPWRPPLACGWAGVAPKAPVPQARDFSCGIRICRIARIRIKLLVFIRVIREIRIPIKEKIDA
jgi:hypothetical protein